MQQGADIQERDFFKEPFSEAEVRALAAGRPVSEVFSWKSPSFKALGLKDADLSEDDLVQLILQEPRLIRRPLVKIGDQLLVGGNIKELGQALE